MPKKIDVHEPDPHFDGKFESVINDATPNQTMGVVTNLDPTNLTEGKKAFEFEPKVDPEMAKFEKAFRGNMKR